MLLDISSYIALGSVAISGADTGSTGEGKSLRLNNKDLKHSDSNNVLI